jgi:tetratricopeptide (TPR) repeat protein
MNYLEGQKLIKQKKFGKALDVFLSLKENTTIDVRVFFYLGIIYFELNNFKKSIFFYKKYLKKVPNSENALYNLAIVKQSTGKIESAKEIYLKLIDLDNNKLRSYLGLLTLDESFLTDTNYKKINDIYKNKNLNYYDKGVINFILAKREKKNKDYNKEIEHLKKFHQNIYDSNYEYNTSSQFYYENIIFKNYNKIEFIDNSQKKSECDQPCPIFIIGLPRSGSTLVESILTSSIDKIESCGESHVINMSILEQIGPKINKKNFTFEIDVSILHESVLSKYLKFNSISKLENRVFLDKSLENFLNIEIILKLFPQAKFLHTYRDPTDSVMSIYQSMLPELSWTHKIEDILNYIDNYHNVISYFKSKYPKNILDIDLKKLTEKNEEISKQIYKFCNLKWNQKTLEFYKRNDLFSKTLSFLQIRKKILKYNEDQYKPYFHTLGKYKKKFKWINCD